MRLTAKRRRAIDWLCTRYARGHRELAQGLGYRLRLNTFSDSDLAMILRYARRQDRKARQCLTPAFPIHCPRCGTYLIYAGQKASGHHAYDCQTCSRNFVVADGKVCPTFDHGATYKPRLGVALSLLEAREHEIRD